MPEPTTEPNITVTVNDHDTGDSETARLPVDSYILICGARREVTHTQQHANGTVVVTIKPLGGGS